jgi:ribonuclease Y
MELIIILSIAVAAGILGIALGWFLRFIITLGQKGSIELEIKEMLLSAREETERITSEAEKEAQRILREAREDIKNEEEKLQKTEERLINKEAILDRRQADLDENSDELKDKEKILLKHADELDELKDVYVKNLEEVSSLSSSQAKENLIKILEKENAEDLSVRLQKIEFTQKEKIEGRAKEILASSIQRLSSSVSSDILTSTVSIPSEEVKGKIIGKEGRNIKSFERMTGVELIIDDTPDTITLSSFDPIRRQIAKVALEELIQDGRIQPARIENIVTKAKEEVSQIIREKGERAAFECGVINLDPKVLVILGRLYFRTSYGQNVLQHSIEVSHLAGMIAEELGVDVKVAKTAGLLHDIGKAVDHEIPGSHVEIGRRILHKFGVDEEVVKAMQSHHEEYPHENTESIVVTVADQISGSRPGARRDTIENYLKRLEDLEKIAEEFHGVEKTYALQAGRELRVFVVPEKISDLEARNLARNIAKKIEEDLQYPGEIKVTVIRENKIVEYAR